MHEPIDGRQRHGLVAKDLTPFAERLVGRDQQGSAFIAGGDQLEQHTGLGLILGDIGDIVEDQQLVLVELADGGLRAPRSRRATCSRWTRSVVRMNSTRRPL